MKTKREDQFIADVVAKVLHIENWNTRKDDRLDCESVPMAALNIALHAAYEHAAYENAMDTPDDDATA